MLPIASDKWYLKAAHAPDFENPRDRRIYRFLEMLPGILMWATLLGTVIASRFAPIGASYFIIAFDIYWLLKTVFLSLHLRYSFGQMQKNLKIDWLSKLDTVSAIPPELKLNNWKELTHLILIPFSREGPDIIKGGLDSILKARYDHKKILIVLGREENAGEEGKLIAEQVESEYRDRFGAFLVTAHPANLPGERPGKGSNVSWMAREAVKTLIEPREIPFERVMVSCFDTDTEVYPEYFSILTYKYLTAKKPLRSSFQPIPVYNNNIWDAPAFSRVVATSGTFWQMMQQARPERLATFSSHSVPLLPLSQMNYWHTNMVSEDSRIFWQALIYFDGDYEVVPLYYPVSMDANLSTSTWETAKAVYKQQRRWIWGVENVPYLLFGFIKNKKIPFRKKIYFGFNQVEGFWSVGTNALMLFLLGWLPILIGGSAFGVSVLAYNLPRVTRWLMTLAMVGMVTSAIYSLMLLPAKPTHKSGKDYLWMTIQWLLIPVTLIGFGSIPGVDAISRLMLGKYMGFWVTPKIRLSQKTAPSLSEPA